MKNDSVIFFSKKIGSFTEANHYAAQNGQNQRFGLLKSNEKQL